MWNSKNPPAFPSTADWVHFKGMELRDWFAGLAMQALIPILAPQKGTRKTLAEAAYMAADAMLAEREGSK